ncbi:MAG: lipid A export permease/ATP-binding protein MsbA [Candidatus Schekmanbacteria bacterium]|nr:MAG: lipid A export permease/ATP-binding protein MsbA [Candidatus Schekmanbacteria bacterium]
MELYSRLFQYVKKYWFRMVVGTSFALVVSSTKGLTAWAVKPALDEIFLKGDKTKLILLPIGILLLFGVQGMARYLQNYLMKHVALKVVMEIRRDLYNHIQSLSLSFFHKIPCGALMSRITNDVKILSSVASDIIPDFLRQIFTLFSLIAVLFYQDWQLAIIAVFILPFVGIMMNSFGKKIKKISKKSLENSASLNSVLQESFSGIKIVKAFVMEEYEKKRFQKVNKRNFDISMKGVRVNEISSPLMEFLGAIAGAFILWYGGFRVINGYSTPGTFFSFLAALALLYDPLRKLTKMNNQIQKAMAGAERVFELMDTMPEIKESESPIHIDSFKEKIEFENVSFMYNKKDGLVLKNINFSIKKGEIVAIVGPSGVGKSTLVDLIPRFYDPTEGKILIDGIDISEVSLSSLRSMIGIVTQETFLFNDTIANNIAYGRQNAAMEEVIEAAKLAYAHDFISAFPDGYDTVIGERGVRLSGGEKQRISIARAILKNPDILILDEATSALDSESEKMVQKALENLMKERTTFVIAHRLSTIVHADRIIVLSDGTIAEIGRHEELLKKKGIYSKLYEIQFRSAEESQKLVTH